MIRDADARFLNAITRRNTAWSYYRDAQDMLAMARDEIGFYDLRPYIANVNETQLEWEYAERDLIRVRVWFRAEQGAA